MSMNSRVYLKTNINKLSAEKQELLKVFDSWVGFPQRPSVELPEEEIYLRLFQQELVSSNAKNPSQNWVMYRSSQSPDGTFTMDFGIKTKVSMRLIADILQDFKAESDDDYHMVIVQKPKEAHFAVPHGAEIKGNLSKQEFYDVNHLMINNTTPTDKFIEIATSTGTLKPSPVVAKRQKLLIQQNIDYQEALVNEPYFPD